MNQNIKERLDQELSYRNSIDELSYQKPDPLMVASRYNDETIALICALFAYGNAKLIVKFLESLPFELLDENEKTIHQTLQNHYYRFQKSDDVIALFVTLKRLKEKESLETIFYRGYQKEENLLDGLWELIATIRNHSNHQSAGYDFLVGTLPKKLEKAGTYKRYLMFFRWMVRRDNLDMGLWTNVHTKNLLMPLDTHSFKVSQKLGLLHRKSCDMKASIELTKTLSGFDPNDPIKYDFALYRIGQEKIQIQASK